MKIVYGTNADDLGRSGGVVAHAQQAISKARNDPAVQARQSLQRAFRSAGRYDIPIVHEGVHPLQTYTEERLASLQRIQSLGVSVTESSGTIVVSGTGEIATEVGFAVVFIERPALATGWEMPNGFSPTAGSWPHVSVGVLRWVTRDYGQREFYVGALIGIAATGVSAQQLVAHWQVKGKAFRNPVGSTEQTI